MTLSTPSTRSLPSLRRRTELTPQGASRRGASRNLHSPQPPWVLRHPLSLPSIEVGMLGFSSPARPRLKFWCAVVGLPSARTRLLNFLYLPAGVGIAVQYRSTAQLLGNGNVSAGNSWPRTFDGGVYAPGESCRIPMLTPCRPLLLNTCLQTGLMVTFYVSIP